MVDRHTFLVTSRLARNHEAFAAARERAHGRQILSAAQAAARLAGGFLQPIERDTLKDALHEVLKDETVDLGGHCQSITLVGLRRPPCRGV